MKLYVNNEQLLAGMTLKNAARPEQNNMALHVCEKVDNILANRFSFTQQIGYTLQDLVCAEQTHSANFYKVVACDKGRGAETMATAIANTDALYTYEKHIILTSFSADCVPILLHNSETGVIAAVHSGWQGTVKEVIPTLLQQLIHVEHNPAHAFQVYINCAISQQKFEVDKDVYDKFMALGYPAPFISYNDVTNKYHIDTQRIVQQQCERAGVPRENIFIDTTCTFESADGFSYRQDKQAGRHMSFIVRK